VLLWKINWLGRPARFAKPLVPSGMRIVFSVFRLIGGIT